MPELAVKRSKGGWTTVAFGDVVRQVKDKVDPEESGLERYIAGEHMDTDDLRIRRWGEIGDGYLGPAFHMRFKPGHVLYGSRRTYLRKVAVADFEGITANTTYVLESVDPEVLLPELLPFIMQTEAFSRHSVRESKGSVNPYVNFSDLAWFEFALPPIEEQRQVARILVAARELREKLFMLGNQSRDVLQSATDALMANHPKCTIRSLINDGLLAPPQDGNHGEKHPKAADYVEEGVPFVMAADLQDGVVNFVECKKLREDDARQLRIGFAQNGDVLLSHKGTLGAVARLHDIPAPFAMLTPQVTYYRVIESTRLIPDWLYFAFRTSSFQRLLLQHGRQSTRAYIGITAQQGLEIPFCGYEDQAVLLARLSSIEHRTNEVVTRLRSVAILQERLLSHGVVA